MTATGTPLNLGVAQKINIQFESLSIRAASGPFQHPAVARHHYERVLAILQEAAPAYSSEWQLADAHFPIIGIHVMGPHGESIMGLILDLANYPHRAMSVVPTDPGFRAPLPRAYGKVADTGRNHLVFNGQTRRFWFCLPGTDEYHSRIADVEPYDRIRDAPEGQPLAVLLACIRHIDVEKHLKEILAQRQLAEQGLA